MTAAVAVVTGANRGLGLEISRQLAAAGHIVYLGSRDVERGAAAARSLRAAAATVHPLALDVTRPDVLAAAALVVEAEQGRLDVLVNNAAIHYDTSNRAAAPDLDVVAEAFETNTYGAWHTMLAFLALLRRSAHGRIVNVSSGAGTLADMGGGLPAYRLSKLALNGLTRMWAAELAGDHILVNSVCPGWVATDMGGPGGRPVEEGAAGIVWAATLPTTAPAAACSATAGRSPGDRPLRRPPARAGRWSGRQGMRPAASAAPSSQQASISAAVGLPVTVTGGWARRQSRPVAMRSIARRAPSTSSSPCR